MRRGKFHELLVSTCMVTWRIIWELVKFKGSLSMTQKSFALLSLAFTYAHKKAFSETFSKTNAHKYGYAWKHDGTCML